MAFCLCLALSLVNCVASFALGSPTAFDTGNIAPEIGGSQQDDNISSLVIRSTDKDYPFELEVKHRPQLIHARHVNPTSSESQTAREGPPGSEGRPATESQTIGQGSATSGVQPPNVRQDAVEGQSSSVQQTPVIHSNETASGGEEDEDGTSILQFQQF